MLIRISKTETGEALYNASDICKSVSLPWNGRRSLPDKLKPNKDFRFIKSALAINDNTSTKVKHYVMTEAGVNKLCKIKKVENPLKKINTLKTAEDVTQHNEIKDLREKFGLLCNVVANLLIGKKVDFAQDNATIIDPVPEIPARVQLRQICVDKAKALAAAHGITDSCDMGVYYEMVFNLLYTKYKQQTQIDLKNLAKQKNTTGLQIADDLGLMDNLLTFAKTNLNIN
jgi:hypothetical protein